MKKRKTNLCEIADTPVKTVSDKHYESLVFFGNEGSVAFYFYADDGKYSSKDIKEAYKLQKLIENLIIRLESTSG